MLIAPEELKRLREQAVAGCYKTVFTRFLTPAQQDAAVSAANTAGCECSFFGGYEDAENRICAFYPNNNTEPLFPLSCVFASAPYGETLAHRDYLGAVMALRIERDVVGDLVPSQGGCYVFCLKHIVSFIEENLISAGRYALKTKEVSLSELALPQRSFEELNINVSSLRLDSVLAALLKVDRESAKKLVLSGAVTADYRECLAPNKQLLENCVITARGYGKYKLGKTNGISRKDRLFVSVYKYK